MSTIKLNLGCGTDYKEGWINIDNNSDNNITRLDINWDLTNPLPFKENTVNFIYNEHFYEHLSVEQGKSLVRNCMSVLAPGGVLRIAMPDLAVAVNNYLNVSIEEEPAIKKYNLGFVKTRAELLNMAFRWWGHQWLYDWEEFERRLREAGCVNIVRETISNSKHVEFINLETRENSFLVAEITK